MKGDKTMSTKIMIVDDHGMVREGLRLLFEQQNDMEVVAEASDGRQAVETVCKLKPDIVLMDDAQIEWYRCR